MIKACNNLYRTMKKIFKNFSQRLIFLWAVICAVCVNNNMNAATSPDNTSQSDSDKQDGICIHTTNPFYVIPDETGKQISTSCKIEYSDTENDLKISFKGTLGNILLNKIAFEREKYKYCQIMCRIILENDESFAAPIYQYYYKNPGKIIKSEDFIEGAVSISEATYSSAVEEIGTDSWNKWSTLKYLCSRLKSVSIKQVEFACDPIDDDFHVFYGFSTNANTSFLLNQSFKAIGNKVGSHEFYHNSWE